MSDFLEEKLNISSVKNVSVYNFLVKPFEFFKAINKEPKFFIPLLLMIVINFVFSIFVSYISYGNGSLNSNMNNQFIQDNKILLISITTGVSVIGQLITTIGMCVFLYFVFSLFFNNIKFRNIFSLMLYAKIPEFIYTITLTIFLAITKDISSLNNIDPTMLDSISKIFNPFNVWHLILFGISIHTLTNMSKKKSFFIVSLFPILNLILEQLI